MPDEAREETYSVVVNDEEQYSIWRADAEVPAGWRADGMSGTREQCLAYIDEVWTDMRPLTLRRQMDGSAT
ncbi:MbtH family protein [Streptomyces sp. NPDC001037]|uniref:MbtH family protein n=1 Tax=Streptomyces sp. NPDC001037 TaxID=3364542 RepID=UPI0036974EF6